MFTGLIQERGVVVAVRGDEERYFTIQSNIAPERRKEGASIACDGVCLTVLKQLDPKPSSDEKEHCFSVQASAETLRQTNLAQWKEGREINLEPALLAHEAMGGHFVTGHIDGVIRVKDVVKESDSRHIFFDRSADLLRFVALKGSVAIDGVSLTVNKVTEEGFGVTIIAHSWEVTTFSGFKPGRVVNIEVDILARYMARLMETA